MSCSCNKNQTPDSVFTALSKAGLKISSADVLGIGLFVVPAPENGILEWKSVLVEDLTYDECMKRGENCEAFQWIPKGLATEVKGKEFTIQCTADVDQLLSYCNDSCRGGCPMGCVCFGNDVRCRPNR